MVVREAREEAKKRKLRFSLLNELKRKGQQLEKPKSTLHVLVGSWHVGNSNETATQQSSKELTLRI